MAEPTTPPSSETPVATETLPPVLQVEELTHITPAETLSPTAPTGPVITAAVCCPEVATFEGSTGVRSSYFGFDDKTNAVANVGTDEYWIPPADTKTIPGDKEDRDGARWVSVGVGKEAQVELNFGGKYTNACLLNCTFEVEPAEVAEVVSFPPIASAAFFKIKGKAAGEASVKIMCDGKLRGYFHVWCVEPVDIFIDFISIVTAKSIGSTISLPTLTQELQETLGQSVINFVITDLGTVDLSANAPFAKVEATFYNSNDEFESNAASLSALQSAAVGAIAARPASEPKTNPSALQLFYYTPTKTANGVVGSVINVGASPAFTFLNNPSYTYNTTAHELGHSLGLVHPNDNFTGGGASQTQQYPPHHTSTLNVATTSMPATNTEPAVPAGEGGLDAQGYDLNILAADPLNLMGYWIDFQQAKPLRYRQWKSCRRHA